MRRGSELLGRKDFWIFLLAEVLILIWICAGWTGNGLQKEFSGEELIYTSGTYQPQFMGGGWYIDSTFGAVEGAVSSPKVDWKPEPIPLQFVIPHRMMDKLTAFLLIMRITGLLREWKIGSFDAK